MTQEERKTVSKGELKSIELFLELSEVMKKHRTEDFGIQMTALARTVSLSLMFVAVTKGAKNKTRFCERVLNILEGQVLDFVRGYEDKESLR